MKKIKALAEIDNLATFMALNCLIIDDSLFIRQTIGSFIEGAGHHVVAMYENGPSFLNSMNELSPPDVIFLDIILPEMTGLDLLNIITEGFPTSKTIMLSGVTHAEAISAALRLGAIDFLQKPVDKDRLIHLLDKLDSTIAPPGVEKLSTIGVACNILSGFIDELIAHSSSTLRLVLTQQMMSILNDVKQKSVEMLHIEETTGLIEPDPLLWGVFSEKEVLDMLTSIPTDLQFELSFLYSEEFVENLFDQAILTMGSKKRFSQYFEMVPPETIGLPHLPSFVEVSEASVTKAGTTFEELDSSISIALFVFDHTGPEIVTRINPDLLTEADLMKNSIFYYTLVDEQNFQEGLFGPLPVTSEYNKSLSSLAYTMKKLSGTDNIDRVIILSIYYTPSADRVVADYNRLSFIIRTRLVPIQYIHEIDKTVMRGLLNDIIDYLQLS